MSGRAPRHDASSAGMPPAGRPRLDPLSPWRLTGLVAPMVVWALHLLVVYSLQGLVCGERWANPRIAGMEALAWCVLALTAASFAALAWMGLRAWRGWRAGSTDRSTPALAARRRFFAAVTAALCALAAIAVLFTTLPVLLLPGCA